VENTPHDGGVTCNSCTGGTIRSEKKICYRMVYRTLCL